MALQYAPLNPAVGEIRLLTLHPGPPEAIIQCNISNAPLGDYSIHDEGIYPWSGGGIAWTRPKSGDADWEISRLPTDSHTGDAVDMARLPQFHGETPDMTGLPVVPTYEALSYTWGDHSVTALIQVNGIELQITLNLFRALQRLRKGRKKRVLWVDALCIDQSNLAERSEQVPRMRSIYQRAERVVVWLGDATEDSDLAVDTLEGLGGCRKDMKNFIKGQGEWFGPQFDHFPGIGRGIKGGERQRVTEGLRHLNLMDPGDVDPSG
jgi:Heterokaryon incompatibility protein (HET)